MKIFYLEKFFFCVGFKQYQTTIAVVEKRSDGVYDLKALKQKNFIDGLCYLLQEIYGIENKKNIDSKVRYFFSKF